MVIKITHTISQPVVDGDSITIGKDTIINETAYDVNGKMRVLLPMEMSQSILMMSRKNGNETISNSIPYDMGTDGKTTTSVKDANGHVNKEVTNEADLMKSENKKKDSEGRSCKKIAKDNKAVWNLKFIQ